MNETYNAASIAFFAGTAVLVAIPLMLVAYLLRLVFREHKDSQAPRESATGSKDRRTGALPHHHTNQTGQTGSRSCASSHTGQSDDFVTPMLVATAITSSLSSDTSNCDTSSASRPDPSGHSSYDCGSSSGSSYDSSSSSYDSGSYSSSGSCGID